MPLFLEGYPPVKPYPIPRAVFLSSSSPPCPFRGGLLPNPSVSSEHFLLLNPSSTARPHVTSLPTGSGTGTLILLLFVPCRQERGLSRQQTAALTLDSGRPSCARPVVPRWAGVASSSCRIEISRSGRLADDNEQCRTPAAEKSGGRSLPLRRPRERLRRLPGTGTDAVAVGGQVSLGHLDQLLQRLCEVEATTLPARLEAQQGVLLAHPRSAADAHLCLSESITGRLHSPACPQPELPHQPLEAAP